MILQFDVVNHISRLKKGLILRVPCEIATFFIFKLKLKNLGRRSQTCPLLLIKLRFSEEWWHGEDLSKGSLNTQHYNVLIFTPTTDRLILPLQVNLYNFRHVVTYFAFGRVIQLEWVG